MQDRYLRQILDLPACPESKKTKKGNTKTEQEDRLNTEQAAHFSYFNCSIVECALVRTFINLIEYSAHEIKGTRLLTPGVKNPMEKEIKLIRSGYEVKCSISNGC